MHLSLELSWKFTHPSPWKGKVGGFRTPTVMRDWRKEKGRLSRKRNQHEDPCRQYRKSRAPDEMKPSIQPLPQRLNLCPILIGLTYVLGLTPFVCSLSLPERKTGKGALPRVPAWQGLILLFTPALTSRYISSLQFTRHLLFIITKPPTLLQPHSSATSKRIINSFQHQNPLPPNQPKNRENVSTNPINRRISLQGPLSRSYQDPPLHPLPLKGISHLR